MIELLVVIWNAGKQACWLAWVYLSLRSPLFPFFLRWFLCYWLSWRALVCYKNWIIALVGPLFDPCVGNLATNLL